MPRTEPKILASAVALVSTKRAEQIPILFIRLPSFLQVVLATGHYSDRATWPERMGLTLPVKSSDGRVRRGFPRNAILRWRPTWSRLEGGGGRATLPIRGSIASAQKRKVRHGDKTGRWQQQSRCCLMLRLRQTG